MANVINYIFNISGNFASNIGIMVKHTEQLTKSVAEATGFMDKLGKKAVSFAAVADVAQNLNNVFSGIIEAGASAELQLMNLKTLFGGNAEAAKDMYERISLRLFRFRLLTSIPPKKWLNSCYIKNSLYICNGSGDQS